MKNVTPPKTGQIICPHCRSTQVYAETRGWSLWSGLIGSGKVMLTCLACGWRFAPPPDPRSTRNRLIVIGLILAFVVYVQMGGHF